MFTESVAGGVEDISAKFDTTSAQVTNITIKECVKSGNLINVCLRFNAPNPIGGDNYLIATFPPEYTPAGNRYIGVAQKCWEANKSCGISVESSGIRIASGSADAGANYIFSGTWICK